MITELLGRASRAGWRNNGNEEPTFLSAALFDKSTIYAHFKESNEAMNLHELLFDPEFLKKLGLRVWSDMAKMLAIKLPAERLSFLHGYLPSEPPIAPETMDRAGGISEWLSNVQVNPSNRIQEREAALQSVIQTYRGDSPTPSRIARMWIDGARDQEALRQSPPIVPGATITGTHPTTLMIDDVEVDADFRPGAVVPLVSRIQNIGESPTGEVTVTYR